MAYDIGDTVRLTATFTDTGGAAADPTTVTFLWEIDGSSSTAASITSASTSVVNPTVGTFYTDVVLTESGTFRWRATSTGTIVTAGEGAFPVRKRYVE